MSFISYTTGNETNIINTLNNNEANLIHALVIKNPNKTQIEKLYDIQSVDTISKPDLFMTFNLPDILNINFLAILWNIQSTDIMKYANLIYVICVTTFNRTDLLHMPHMLSIDPRPSDFQIIPPISLREWSNTRSEIFRISNLFLQELTDKFLNKNILENKDSHKNNQDSQQTQSCSICLEDINNDNTRQTTQPKKIDLPCNHNFHYPCIKQWIETENEQKSELFKSNSTCPICRVLLIKEEQEEEADAAIS